MCLLEFTLFLQFMPDNVFKYLSILEVLLLFLRIFCHRENFTQVQRPLLSLHRFPLIRQAYRLIVRLAHALKAFRE
jgi:hypothetical protein